MDIYDIHFSKKIGKEKTPIKQTKNTKTHTKIQSYARY